MRPLPRSLTDSMRWPNAKRSLGIYVVLLGCGAGVCAWQWGEHQRFKQTARQALINRGRDITTTLGIVVSSQRRFGNLVVKDRIESALQGLIHEGELESIAIVGATGETIASAGPPVELTREITRGGGVYWQGQRLTLMNLMDLGTRDATPEEKALPAALVVSNPRMNKAFRTGTKGVAARAENRPGASAVSEEASTAPAPNPSAPSQRFPYSRPPWMEKEEYDAVIKKQGVHSLVISLSTDEMRRAIQSDLLLRSLVSLLASGAAIVSVFAWRNLSRNSELQIRLVKAGEMNSHLSQMNFAAAGLAHET